MFERPGIWNTLKREIASVSKEELKDLQQTAAAKRRENAVQLLEAYRLHPALMDKDIDDIEERVRKHEPFPDHLLPTAEAQLGAITDAIEYIDGSWSRWLRHGPATSRGLKRMQKAYEGAFGVTKRWMMDQQKM